MTDIHSCSYYCDRPACIKAQRDELRERLAQPEQKPFCYHDGRNIVGKEYAHHCDVFPLYTEPHPEQEPLTDEQIDKLPWGPHEGNPMTFAEGLRDFARAIEAAHGIGEKK